MRAPELVFLGATVETITPHPGPAPAAVAVAQGRITAVGSVAEIEPLLGSTTRVIRLEGQTLLPGFQDAHIHPISGGLSYAAGCALYDLAAKDAYVRKVAECAQSRPPGAWVRGDE